jgi:hypothetical protein
LQVAVRTRIFTWEVQLGGGDQQFKLIPVSGGKFAIQSRSSELCRAESKLSVKASGDDNIDVWWDDLSGSQHWTVDMPVKLEKEVIKSVVGTWRRVASGTEAMEVTLEKTVTETNGNSVETEKVRSISVDI